MEKMLEALREHGYKLTPQRRAVLQAMHGCAKFPTAQQILTEVRKEMPEISFDTVYRTLTLFTKLGITHEVYRPSGMVYELAEGHHHHHLVCTECGRTECLDVCPVSEAYLEEAKKKGFQITGHVFEFFGLCKDCQKKRNR